MFVQTNTVKAIKTYFKDRLKDQFSENEIRFMIKEAVLKRLKITSADYLLADDALLSESDLLYFRNIVKRLQSNEPFQYIIGQTDFYGLTIKTDERALIPRPETEELVGWVLSSFDDKSKIEIMDLCTGSGCIALAIKSNRPEWSVSGCDLSEEALSLAKENATSLDLKVSFLKLDVLDQLNDQLLNEAKFDCWVSNPPYIPVQESKEMNKNVTGFEPGMALFVPDDDVLLFYKAIALKGKRHLKQNGLLFFEIHENFGQATKEMIESHGYVNVTIKKDHQGKDRMIKAVFSGN